MEVQPELAPARSRSVRLFGITLAIYVIFFAGHYVMGDHAARMAWARAMLDHGSHDIDPETPGIQYSIYGIGHSLLHIPFLLLARAITGLTGIPCEGPVNMFLYPVNAALACVAIYRIVLRHGLEERWAFRATLGVGVGSIWIAYTKVEYSESIVATLLLWCWDLAPRRPILAGIIGGWMGTIRTESLAWAGLTWFIAIEGTAPRIRFAIAALPGILLALGSNWWRTGQLHTSGYDAGGFSNPIWIGLHGILFSAGKSVFLFTPLLLLGWNAVGQAWQDRSRRRLVTWAVLLFFGHLLLYACWWDWSGDDSWGVRFVIPGVLAILILVVLESSRHPRLFAGLAVLGLMIQLPALLFGPHTSLMLNHERYPKKLNLYQWSESPITIDDLRYHPRYSQVVASWELLIRKISGGDIKSRDSRLTGTTWFEGFDVPPEPAWDLLWLSRLSSRGTRMGN